jgi:hypothetical protein
MDAAHNGRRIIVTSHAISAFARRQVDRESFDALAECDWEWPQVRAHYGTAEAARLWEVYKTIGQEIIDCVRTGIEQGLVFTRKPANFFLYGQKHADLPDGDRFVCCDPDPEIGFIVKRKTDGRDIVVTTLTRTGVHK